MDSRRSVVSVARNEALKTSMIYGYAPLYPGIVKFEDGNPKFIDAASLVDLTQSIDDVSRNGFDLSIKILEQCNPKFIPEEDIEID